MLTFSVMPAGAQLATDEERLDSIRDNTPAFGAQQGKKYELTHDERISENGVSGRELEFAAGEKYTVRTKVFILDNRLYRIIAVTPRSQKEDEATQRFLSSFRFEKNKN
jgi:hypothetical protein